MTFSSNSGPIISTRGSRRMSEIVLSVFTLAAPMLNYDLPGAYRTWSEIPSSPFGLPTGCSKSCTVGQQGGDARGPRRSVPPYRISA